MHILWYIISHYKKYFSTVKEQSNPLTYTTTWMNYKMINNKKSSYIHKLPLYAFVHDILEMGEFKV
jgi:hypothetical protein